MPDLGPKKVALFWRELGITDLAGLEAAAREGKLRDLPGMGAKSETKVLAGIEALGRRSGRIAAWASAWPFAQKSCWRCCAACRVCRAVGDGRQPAPQARHRGRPGHPGRGRRFRSRLWQAFTGRPDVLRVSGQGPTKASVEFRQRPARPAVGAPARALRHRPAVRHRLQGSQRAPARAGAQAGAVAFRPRPDAATGRLRDLVRHAKRKSTPRWGCPGSRPNCARIAARSQAAQNGELPQLIEQADLRRRAALPHHLERRQADRCGEWPKRPAQRGLQSTGHHRSLRQPGRRRRAVGRGAAGPARRDRRRPERAGRFDPPVARLRGRNPRRWRAGFPG